MLAELEELAELGRPTPAPERGRMMSYWVWDTTTTKALTDTTMMRTAHSRELGA
jgi:hypothetical protein